MSAGSIGADNRHERAERVQLVRDTIDATVGFVNSHFPGAVSVKSGIVSIVTANCYFLLSNAYKRARLVDNSRTYNYKVAAMTAAAIMSVRPIRFNRQVRPDEDLVRYANWDCATRASLSLLDLSLDNYDPEFLRRFHRATLGPISLPCLSSYLERFDNLVFMQNYPDSVEFDNVERIVPFAPFNNIDLRGSQLIQIEQLINIYQIIRSCRDV